MSRQPRKVFGFTGGAKYGPLAADPPKGDSAAGAPKAADMDRNNNSGQSQGKGFCDPEGGFCKCVDSILFCCKLQDCL